MDKDLVLPPALNREITELHTPEDLETRRIERFNADDKRDNKIVIAALVVGSLVVGAGVYISTGQTAENEAAKAQRNAAIVREIQNSNQITPGLQNDVTTLRAGTDEQGNITFTPIR